MDSSEPRALRRIARRTAWIYVAVAGAWILLSDRAVSMMTSDLLWVERIAVLKGWFFVLVTGTLLYLGLRRQLGRVETEAAERRRAIEALREQRWRLDSIIEGTNVGTWEWNVQSGALAINERWAAMLGYSVAELEPLTIKTWNSLAHPDDLGESTRLIERHFAGESRIYEYECRMRHRDGHWIWVHDRGRVITRSADSRPLMMFGTHTDITARKRAELEIREAEERFRQIAENINEVFWIFDATERRLLYVSPAFDSIWGRSSAELLRGDYRWSDAIHPDDQARVLAANREKMLAGDYDEVYRIRLPDGTERWIHDRAFPVRDAAGQVCRVVGTAEDVTGRRRLEEQFRQAQKMQAIGTLAGGIAHDFNNLLGAINGCAELAALQVKNQPEVSEYLRDIRTAGKRAAGLVRQILAFSRKSASERSVLHLYPLLEEAQRLLRATLPTTIEIVLSRGPRVWPVRADPNHVHQVVMNLGTNAWHAMRESVGRMDIRLENFERTAGPAETDLRLRPGRYVRVSIRDSGCGMEAQTAERVFEPFFTTKGPGEGTGLGLSVVHGIMQEHEGAVTVETAPGEGSVFHLYFPAADPVNGSDESGEKALRRGQGEMILFVDDEAALVRLGQGMLEELGYRPEGAFGALEALSMLRGDPGRYALVVTDQTMPVMTGVELFHEVRGIRPDLPVILVTGYTATLTPERARELGLAELLMKPLSLARLGEALDDVLHNTRKST